MRGATPKTVICYLAVGLLELPLQLSSVVRGEQLPLKLYTTAGGLARDQVNRIVRDSHGFLWFATEEGLSRFDGYKFTNYTTDRGLPHRTVNDLLETRDRTYWIATDGGLCRFKPSAPPMFIVYYPGEDTTNIHSGDRNESNQNSRTRWRGRAAP